MTDVTGKTPTPGAPKPRKPATGAKQTGSTSDPRTAGASVGGASTSKTGGAAGAYSAGAPSMAPQDAAPSRQGDVSSDTAAELSKSRKPVALSEEDSVLLAGLESVQSRAEALRDWALIRREEAKDAVRTHPLGSSVIVFGAGMIFGLLLARR